MDRSFWQSLATHAWAWGIVYGLSAVLYLPITVLGMAFGTLGVGLTIILYSPYLAFAWFTYARLLGRLLWRIHYTPKAAKQPQPKPGQLPAA